MRQHPTKGPCSESNCVPRSQQSKAPKEKGRWWGGGGDKGPGHQRILANGLKMQSEREVRAILETEQLLTSKFPRKHRTRQTQLTLLTKQPNTALCT